MNRTLLITGILLMAGVLQNPVNAQQHVSYTDVGLIINSNSPVSEEIGEYFRVKRNIPERHIFRIDVPFVEEIGEVAFQDYLMQVQQILTERNLADSLNYLVTTKGCPLKVLRVENDTSNCNSSVESELMLIPSPQHIGSCITFEQLNAGTYFKNPYFTVNGTFSKADYGIYLVTRLDGYTAEKVKSLIDRSGPNTLVIKDSTLFVMDQSPAWTGIGLNTELGTTAALMTSAGWPILLNSTNLYVTNQQHVLGYASWGSNDPDADTASHARPSNTWVNGSIAETHVSTSGRSFEPGTAYGQSLIADLIEEGVTGAKGYVYEPFTAAIAISSILFSRYVDMSFDGTPDYNLAESYFSASRMIGWKDVVIGDPKTSITTNELLASAMNSVNLTRLQIYPNPASHTTVLNMQMPATQNAALSIYDSFGRLVHSETLNPGTVQRSLALDLFPSGIYLVKIHSENTEHYEKLLVIKD